MARGREAAAGAGAGSAGAPSGGAGMEGAEAVADRLGATRSRGATAGPRVTMSLATEAFPELNEGGMRRLTSPWGGEHDIVLLPNPNAAAASTADRVEAWIGAGGDAPWVVALHVGIADPVDARSFARLRAALPECRLLTNFGVGLNHLDLTAAAAHGFEVTNTPDVLTDATADVALLLLLLVTREARPALDSLSAAGRYEGWKPVAAHMGRSLAGKTLGIVGLGRIGTAFARRARALGMRVVALQGSGKDASNARSILGTGVGQGGGLGAGVGEGGGIPRLPEGAFLSACDVVSLHCPLAPGTRGWLSRERLERLKAGAYVINTARGEIIDESALAGALLSGRLAGAGLDVFAGEPVLSEALRSAPRLVVLPHIGSATWETRRAMGSLNEEALLRRLRVLQGESDSGAT